MILFDPNLSEDQNDFDSCFVRECSSFGRGMKLWANGENLWVRMYGDDRLLARSKEQHAARRLLG